MRDQIVHLCLNIYLNNNRECLEKDQLMMKYKKVEFLFELNV